jgi:hypothetical protein
LADRSNPDRQGFPSEGEVEAVAQRFREAWQSKATPPLADFLPPPGTRGRTSALHALISMDLEARWSRGLRIILDDYVRTFPELGLMGTLPVRLIFQEYRVRQLFGDRPALETYRTRFPPQFGSLQRMVREQEATHGPRAGGDVPAADAGRQPGGDHPGHSASATPGPPAAVAAGGQPARSRSSSARSKCQ